MANICLKVLKDNCSRLRKSLSLKAFACLKVLLSVVAQALLLTIVCRSLPSLSSGDAVDSYQWEVQASKC
jgi:hypothetical protein